jgi:hypothetical protein
MGHSSDHTPRNLSLLSVCESSVYAVTRIGNRREEHSVCWMRSAVWRAQFPLNAENRIWRLSNYDVTKYSNVLWWSSLRHSIQYTNKPTGSFLDGSVSIVIREGLWDRRLRVQLRAWAKGFSLVHSVLTDCGSPAYYIRVIEGSLPKGPECESDSPPTVRM